MNVSSKTEYNERSRMHLEFYCNRPGIEMQIIPIEEWLKPKANYKSKWRWSKINKTNAKYKKIGVKYKAFDKFIIECNIQQVYYIPYPSF